MGSMESRIERLGGRQIDRRQFLRRAAALGLSLPAASALLAASGPGATAGAAPRHQAPARPAAGAEADLAPIIEAAKREGVVAAAGNSLQFDECRKALGDAFRARYGLPGSFKVDLVLKNIGPIQKQVEEEMAAGKVSLDVVYMNVVSWFAAMAKRGKLMAFDAPEYKAYARQDDKPGFNNRPYYVSDVMMLGSLAWNKDIIRDNTFTSWFDLLRPEYKGKITTLSVRLAASWGVTYKAMKEAPGIGRGFFERLAKLEPVTLQFTEAMVEKVVSGEYPIALASSTRPYGFWKLQGARNIGQSFPREGVVPLAAVWAALADAPHPNAAKLLVNFARSREGQQIMADYEGRISGRPDVVSPSSVYVPNLSDLKLLWVDQVNISPQEFRQLGREWEAMFGM